MTCHNHEGNLTLDELHNLIWEQTKDKITAILNKDQVIKEQCPCLQKQIQDLSSQNQDIHSELSFLQKIKHDLKNTICSMHNNQDDQSRMRYSMWTSTSSYWPAHSHPYKHSSQDHPAPSSLLLHPEPMDIKEEPHPHKYPKDNLSVYNNFKLHWAV